MMYWYLSGTYLIDEFHQGPSRTLWGTYQGLKPDALVATAVALQVLATATLPPGIAALLAEKSETFKELARDEPQAPAHARPTVAVA